MSDDDDVGVHGQEVEPGVDQVSPLETLLVETLKFKESALSLLAAISKEDRVRVEASKKRLMTVLPRSVGTFLIGRVRSPGNFGPCSEST
jgi:hypothetical protein